MKAFRTGLCSCTKDLRTLHNNADDKSVIVVFSRDRLWIKHFLYMVKRGYLLRHKAREYNLKKLRYSGRVVSVWSRTYVGLPRLCPIFCRSESELHILNLWTEPVLDLSAQLPVGSLPWHEN